MAELVQWLMDIETTFFKIRFSWPFSHDHEIAVIPPANTFVFHGGVVSISEKQRLFLKSP